MHPSCHLSLSLLLALVLHTPRAHAQPSDSLTLHWSAPASCPSSARVHAAINRALPSPQQPLTVEGTIRRQASDFVLSLSVTHGALRFRRSLRAARCDELAESAAFLLALALAPPRQVPTKSEDADAARPPAAVESAPAKPDARPLREHPSDDAVSGEGTRAPSSPSNTASTAEPRHTQPPAPSAPKARSKPPPRAQVVATKTAPLARAIRLSAGGGLFALGLADPAPALLLALGIEFARWSWSLSSAYLPGRTHVAPVGRVKFTAQQLQVQLCRDFGDERLRYAPCGALGGMVLHASPDGLVNARDQSRALATTSVSLRGSLVLTGPLSLSLEGGALLPLSPRPQFEVGGLGSLGELSVVAPFLQLALVYSLR